MPSTIQEMMAMVEVAIVEVVMVTLLLLWFLFLFLLLKLGELWLGKTKVQSADSISCSNLTASRRVVREKELQVDNRESQVYWAAAQHKVASATRKPIYIEVLRREEDSERNCRRQQDK